MSSLQNCRWMVSLLDAKRGFIFGTINSPGHRFIHVNHMNLFAIRFLISNTQPIDVTSLWCKWISEALSPWCFVTGMIFFEGWVVGVDKLRGWWYYSIWRGAWWVDYDSMIDFFSSQKTLSPLRVFVGAAIPCNTVGWMRCLFGLTLFIAWGLAYHECLYTNPSRCPAQHLAKVARARGVTVSQGLLPESFTASALDQAEQNWNFHQKFDAVDHNINRLSTCQGVSTIPNSTMLLIDMVLGYTASGDFWKAQFGLLDAKAVDLTGCLVAGNFQRLSNLAGWVLLG